MRRTLLMRKSCNLFCFSKYEISTRQNLDINSLNERSPNGLSKDIIEYNFDYVFIAQWAKYSKFSNIDSCLNA